VHAHCPGPTWLARALDHCITPAPPFTEPNAISLLTPHPVRPSPQATAATANSVSDINAWAKNVTQGLIPELLAPGTPFDVVLANALYFKGKWRTQFEGTSTRPWPFTTAKGVKQQVRGLPQNQNWATAGLLGFAASPHLLRPHQFQLSSLCSRGFCACFRGS
jgi:hypothetical protein